MLFIFHCAKPFSGKILFSQIMDQNAPCQSDWKILQVAIPKGRREGSSQYLKREGANEAGFLHADKYPTFLQVDLQYWWAWPIIPIVPKIASLQYLKKDVRGEN